MKKDNCYYYYGQFNEFYIFLVKLPVDILKKYCQTFISRKAIQDSEYFFFSKKDTVDVEFTVKLMKVFHFDNNFCDLLNKDKFNLCKKAKKKNNNIYYLRINYSGLTYEYAENDNLYLGQIMDALIKDINFITNLSIDMEYVAYDDIEIFVFLSKKNEKKIVSETIFRMFFYEKNKINALKNITETLNNGNFFRVKINGCKMCTITYFSGEDRHVCCLEEKKEQDIVVEHRTKITKDVVYINEKGEKAYINQAIDENDNKNIEPQNTTEQTKHKSKCISDKNKNMNKKNKNACNTNNKKLCISAEEEIDKDENTNTENNEKKIIDDKSKCKNVCAKNYLNKSKYIDSGLINEIKIECNKDEDIRNSCINNKQKIFIYIIIINILFYILLSGIDKYFNN